jgi:putative ABC transport system ATP-binding protein
MTVLEANNLTKSFTEGGNHVEVLKGVSLQMRRGEVLALEGPSGSGKTTLLSILGCILTPTAGELKIDGEKVSVKKLSNLPSIRKKSIGFVFQQFNLFPALTARENIQYALNIKGNHSDQAKQEAEAMLEAVGLSDRKDFLPRDLSGGQKQRVAIARALVGQAPIILADEPTANLDYHTGEQVLDIFKNLAKQQDRALLIVTHDPKVRAIADRTLSIRDGHLTT